MALVTPGERLALAAVDAAIADRALQWRREGEVLVKEVRLGSFPDALAYVQAVGAVAEAMGHHPDIDIRWRSVVLRLTTHSAGGLTELDLVLAARIDELGNAAQP